MNQYGNYFAILSVLLLKNEFQTIYNIKPCIFAHANVFKSLIFIGKPSGAYGLNLMT